MTETARRIVVYLALLALLGVSLAATALEPGTVRTALHLLAAAMQTTLIVAVFMQLRGASALVRVFALGSLLWLLILFGFMAVDYLHR